MSTAAAVALFVLGVWLSMRTLASWYRVLDLWYTIATAWPRVAAGILVWSLVPAAIALALGGRGRSAFLWGWGGYAVFYLVVAWLLKQFLMASAARSGAE